MILNSLLLMSMVEFTFAEGKRCGNSSNTSNSGCPTGESCEVTGQTTDENTGVTTQTYTCQLTGI